jgi:hypothetical protein
MNISLLLYFNLLSFYGWENEEWRKSYVTGIRLFGHVQNAAGLKKLAIILYYEKYKALHRLLY